MFHASVSSEVSCICKQGMSGPDLHNSRVTSNLLILLLPLRHKRRKVLGCVIVVCIRSRQRPCCSYYATNRLDYSPIY